MYMFACVYMCMGVHTHACENMWVSEADVMSFSVSLHLTLERQGLSLNLELND